MNIAVGQLDRQTYLGGSDVAAILGLSPYRTPLDVYLDKVEGKQPDDPAKMKIFKRGTRLEPYILDMLVEETGLELVKRGERYRDRDHEFLAAEIDAEASTGENIEAKSVNQFGAKEWGTEWTDEIPVHYTAQAMHGMMINGAPRTIFPVLIGIDDFRVYKVERDEETIAGIKAKELEFWQRIQSKEAPEATTVGDIERLFARDHGSVVQASDDIVEAYKALKDLKKRIKLLEDDADDKAKLIKLFMREHQILKFGADTLLTWKSQETTRLVPDLFRAAHPRIAQKFERTTTSRVLRLK